MMEICTNPPPQDWDRFVADHPQAHVLQTSPWAELKAAFGWQPQRLMLDHYREETIQGSLPDEWCWNAWQDADESGRRPAGGGQILYRNLPGGLGQLAYVPCGPLVDWQDREVVSKLLQGIQEAARAQGALALTLEPCLLDEAAIRELLADHGFIPSPLGSVQPRRTIVVDISGEESDILAAMKSKTRYNIRLAGRKGVVVREAEVADLPAFERLMATTAERNEFGVHDPAYYEHAYRLFVPRGWARLLLAEVEKEAVAALMVFALGKRAWYFYGASANVHRKKMPTYLLQWEAIRWARSRGCTEYDLWGIPDEDEEALEAQFTQRSDGLWGVYRFKRGFGGRVERTVGAWDLPLNAVRYRLYTLATRVRDGIGAI